MHTHICTNKQTNKQIHKHVQTNKQTNTRKPHTFESITNKFLGGAVDIIYTYTSYSVYISLGDLCCRDGSFELAQNQRSGKLELNVKSR